MPRPSYALVRRKVLKSIENTVIDKFFSGVDGISTEYGITTTSEPEAEIIRKIMILSKITILVADIH